MLASAGAVRVMITLIANVVTVKDEVASAPATPSDIEFPGGENDDSRGKAVVDISSGKFNRMRSNFGRANYGSSYR